jgi:hypothetical protein
MYPIFMTPVTDEHIAQLRSAAQAADDQATVLLCTVALGQIPLTCDTRTARTVLADARVQVATMIRYLTCEYVVAELVERERGRAWTARRAAGAS